MERPFSHPTGIEKDGGNNYTKGRTMDGCDIANIGERDLNNSQGNVTPAIEMLSFKNCDDDESEMETVEIIHLNSSGQGLDIETEVESYLVEGKKTFFLNARTRNIKWRV